MSEHLSIEDNTAGMKKLHAKLREGDISGGAKVIAEIIDADILKQILQDSDRVELHEFILNRLKQISDEEFQVSQEGEYVSITRKNLDVPNAHKGIRIYELDFTSQRTWDKIGAWLNG